MDFLDSNLQQEIMHKKDIYSYSELEDDDEAFYNELRRQVLQLTEEEDDDHDAHVYGEKKRDIVEARRQGPNNGAWSVGQSRCSFDWHGNAEDYVAPAWILNLWRTGTGTGVFIPQVVQSRRRNRTRRKNERGRMYRRVEKMN